MVYSSLWEPNGFLDKMVIVFVLLFTTAWTLGVVLNVSEFSEDIIRQIFSMFGMLDTGSKLYFAKVGLVTGASGAYSMPVFGMYLPWIMGKEDEAMRKCRHLYGFWLCLGWFVCHFKYLIMSIIAGDSGSDDDVEPYGGSPANYYWVISNAFMIYVHFRWVGKDVIAKLKLA